MNGVWRFLRNIMDIHYVSCCSNRFSMRFNVQTFILNTFEKRNIENDSFFEVLLDLIFVGLNRASNVQSFNQHLFLHLLFICCFFVFCLIWFNTKFPGSTFCQHTVFSDAKPRMWIGSGGARETHRGGTGAFRIRGIFTQGDRTKSIVSVCKSLCFCISQPFVSSMLNLVFVCFLIIYIGKALWIHWSQPGSVCLIVDLP